MKVLNTDVAIIGAGTAGLSAYRAVKAAGKRAILIEGGPYGTTCARVGCMPSKLLIAAAEAAHTAASAAPFGVHIDGSLRIDGKQVMDRVKRERDRFVGFVLESVEGIPASDKIRGYARFLSDTVLQVDDHTEITAGSIVIATGSSPFIPESYRALGDRVVVNDDVFYWDDLPDSVMVLGSGVIGLELGQALARLGVNTTIVNRSGGAGGLTDPEVRASAVKAFQAELALHLNASIKSTRRDGDQVVVSYQSEDGAEHTVSVDYLLVATGRTPNVKELDLHNTSAVLNDKGMPVYDSATLQVGRSPIFIAGDVNGVLPLLHEAADDGQFAGENAAAYPEIEPAQRRAPMAVVFSDPQLAQAGMRFKDLPSQGVVIGEVDFSNQGRSRVMLKNRGKLRVYGCVRDGRFLGAEMAGPAMEHIAHLLAWAVQKELSVAEMLKMPFYHPVVEEGLRTALRDCAKKLAAAELEHVCEGDQAVNSA
ncbi:dihydrolipoyl dehydrogenase [Pollutimonas harenae]|uniref:Dihydrolipoyl dehydrogenase n=1 Tax=Pollutimonas harenae TaxID=657015 RepID=A0A853H6E9_9BURK|nr:dihydrolipoyl dehydrogenase [Pollutimonas harenae]NYT86093.1 dihydrolipoyl dehydrogenase [Pollutimonas harenae]TEA71138.1 dihydrolipoyl dehydrogenase [Pollutimonas harenae]